MIFISIFSGSFIALTVFLALKLFEMKRGARILGRFRSQLDRLVESAYEGAFGLVMRLQKDYSVRVARRFMHKYNSWYSSLGYTTGYAAPKVLAFLEGRRKRERPANSNGDSASSFLREVAEYKKDGEGRIEEERPHAGS